MSHFFATLTAWAVKHQSKMPQWIRRLMESAVRNPDGFLGRLSARLLGGKNAPVTEVPESAISVYIAPTNYSGQGYLWARALESANTSIHARNMAIELPGGFAFSADTLVPIAAVNGSEEWAAAEWTAASHFSHVLVEAERSMFGKKFDRNLEHEIEALQAAGVSVALLCHGTDIRDPDKHAQLTPWSLYPEDPRTDILREDAHKNRALIDRLNLPTFISTPDLITDVPEAHWCPVVVDGDRFATPTRPFTGGPVRIVHATSNPLAKGSHYIEPALAPLLKAQEVTYRQLAGLPSRDMPAAFESADIVIDQFRAGSYGAAACEAMASGRVVIGHVLPSVRQYIEQVTGLALPIVEATPDTLREVVAGLMSDPRTAGSIAASGPTYVQKVHSGAASAQSLLDNWILPQPSH